MTDVRGMAASAMERAREGALREMKEKTSERSADAVVGIDLDDEVMASASGTAVKLM